MNSLTRTVSKIFFYGIPVIAAIYIMALLRERGLFSALPEWLAINHSLAGLFIFSLWMIMAVYLSLQLLISKNLRENVLARFSRIKENDEREVYLTGKATKNTYLLTLGFLIVLLCLSCIKVSLYQLPPEQAIGGKSKVLQIGMNLNMLEHHNHPTNTHGKTIFSTTALPLSANGIILLLLVWNIYWYNTLFNRAVKTEQ